MAALAVGNAALTTSTVSSQTGKGSNRIIDVGDLPDGVRSRGPESRQQGGTAAADTLDLSSQAKRAARTPSTQPVGIEPNPSPHPNPRDSASAIDTRA